MSTRTETEKLIAEFLNTLVQEAYWAAIESGWYGQPIDGKVRDSDVPRSLCLIHSEISEALDGHRKQLMDEKLPHRKMIEVELADAVIRIADLCGSMGLDLGGAVVEKMAYNAQREDHRQQSREAAGGKRF